jgi:shikimate dehydrogenase
MADMPEIDGTTEILALIGMPTHTFKAPLIYNPWFACQDTNAVVVPMGCGIEEYPEFLRLLFRLSNVRGALIIMPHKVTTAGLLDEAHARVRVAGACNAVRRGPQGRLIGDLFDGEGFVAGLEGNGRRPEGASALIIGCGGVGSAIAASLAKAGVAKLGLYNRTPSKAEALARRVVAEYPGLEIALGTRDPRGWDIAVNATPLGMKPGDPMPLDVRRLGARTFVGEVVLSRPETDFLAAARARGCRTQIGLDMLLAQIPSYLEFFGLPVATPEQLRAVAKLPSID